jgi:predicted N-acetyltransferase YhbS
VTTQLRIEQLAERPEWLPVIADWIYNEWWTSVDGASVGTLSDLLRTHLILDQMPLTLIASLDSRPVGTVTLLAHDVGTEQWSSLSPWLAALYVLPQYRRRGIGGALMNAVVAKSTALGEERLHLLTIGREQFYTDLGWQVVDRNEKKVVMTNAITTQLAPSQPQRPGSADPEK